MASGGFTALGVTDSGVFVTVSAFPVNVAFTDMVGVESRVFDTEIALISIWAITAVASCVAGSLEDRAVLSAPVLVAYARSILL